MLKCQFHIHVHGDPADYISYTSEQLIDEAARADYDVISITCHRKIIFTQELKEYAQNKGILLIPGIEFEIDKKHILGINIDEKIYGIDSFEKLREYRKLRPDCLIIATHPFFPGNSLGKALIRNIDCFDAIEYSWAYTTLINFNKKADALAKKYSKPLIATSDCHILNYLDLAYTMVDAAQETEETIKAIKNGSIRNHGKPTGYFRIARSIGQVGIQTAFKKLHR